MKNFFSHNLKKIRIAKNLNQSDLAKIFGLTRSTIGAYEEGRAEPKIDKIIEIANYFGIDVGHMLTKKLTINEIVHYDEKKIQQASVENPFLTPFVPKNIYKQYIENFSYNDFIIRLPKISLPEIDNTHICFEIDNPESFFHNDLLICQPLKNKTENFILNLHKEKPIITYSKILKQGVVEHMQIKYFIFTSPLKTNIAIFLNFLKEKEFI